MRTTHNRTFKGETIDIDGQEFVGCTFENCVLRYSGGEIPRLHGCHAPDLRISIDGAAANTLGFLRSLYLTGAAPIVADLLAPIMAPVAKPN